MASSPTSAASLVPLLTPASYLPPAGQRLPRRHCVLLANTMREGEHARLEHYPALNDYVIVTPQSVSRLRGMSVDDVRAVHGFVLTRELEVYLRHSLRPR